MIKLFKPYLAPGTLGAVSSTLLSGQLAQGGSVNRFEDDFVKKFNVIYPVSLNSGTAALELAYELLDIKEGDDVVTSPLTCLATNLPILRRGANIIWADIDPNTLCIDKFDVMRKITKRTKAIVNVNLGGFNNSLGDMPRPVVADSCQALGVFNGDYVCNSFQAIKHITTGDGGMLSVKHKADYDKAKLLRWFGIDREREVPNTWESYLTRMMSFEVNVPGTKRHMNDIAASMGLRGLEAYDDIINTRRMQFDLYKKFLGNYKNIKVIGNEDSTHWLLTILVKNRDNFAKVLWNAGIETNVVQVRNDKYRVFDKFEIPLPNMNMIQDKYISLPIGMHITNDNIQYICETIKKGW